MIKMVQFCGSFLCFESGLSKGSRAKTGLLFLFSSLTGRMADPFSPTLSDRQISPFEASEKLKKYCRGNSIFNEESQAVPIPVQQPLCPQDSNSDPYHLLKNYHDRLRQRRCTSPELNRRYFSDLEGSPQLAIADERTFTGHLATRTSQLDRMDLNTVTGKNSLFLANRDDEALDIVPCHLNSMRTDSGARLILPFTKETFLGEGRHSKVYKGSILFPGSSGWHDVAVKLSFKEFENIESMEHELSVMKGISPLNIVSVMDTVKLKGNNVFELGYVMEVAEFGTLESFVLANDVFSLSLAQFLSWSRELFCAVKALQDAGITHFDIKPQNLLVMKDYTLRLGDFGEAICRLDPDYSETRGRGTLHYTAPELLQLDNEGPCNGSAVDVYSAGLVMYSLMTGRLPWMGIRGPATHQIVICKKGFSVGSYNPIPSPSTTEEFKLPGPNGEILPAHITRQLSTIIIGCTSLNPTARPTVDDALKLLDEIKL